MTYRGHADALDAAENRAGITARPPPLVDVKVAQELRRARTGGAGRPVRR
ncbi:protein of unassigned function [Methylobacterium oryzae CBMB20]|uniref:Protein of unassigned function n=1 Tax=Methylobacterium oryzae CBMB20 TaxID=693986 RepID=A0A089NNF2_9HYPH|nr:protein of unassigned function [Methylobacterium oryzae CBMB20]